MSIPTVRKNLRALLQKLWQNLWKNNCSFIFNDCSSMGNVDKSISLRKVLYFRTVPLATCYGTE